jgi:hypothetical protein
MITAPKKTRAKSKPSPVLGRSPLTGQLVLRPKSKTGAITLRDAKLAVARVRAAAAQS